jgi:DNA-directed RNA polymerase specialized sigma24 family protein
MSSPMTDKEIIQRVLAGETEEFRTLLKRYKGLVFHIVRYMIPNEADREDLGQDIFLKAYQGLSSFKFQSGLATGSGPGYFSESISRPVVIQISIRFGDMDIAYYL